MIMEVAGYVRFPALVLPLLGHLALTVPQLANGLTNSLPVLESEKTDSLLTLLCAQPSLSLSPAASAHALRPTDISVISAIGLPHFHRSELTRAVNGLSALLSLSSPALTRVLPDQTNTLPSQHRGLPEQALDLVLSLNGLQTVDPNWKLVLLFVPVDELCGCPEQVRAALGTAVQQFEKAVQILQSQLNHTLVSTVVWAGPYDARVCLCKEPYSETELRLMKTVLAQSLQESLERHLEARQWYSDRDDFTVLLQPSHPAFMPEETLPPAGQSTQHPDHLAIQLLTNLLQPVSRRSDLESNDIVSTLCPNEDRPYLRTWRNSPLPLHAKVRSDPSLAFPHLEPIMGSELPCEIRSPSPFPPTSVHSLRPADIKVVAAVGDSLTAANGVGASPNNLLDVIRQYRGLSWSIGGNGNLTTVTTLPNILREFNPALAGFSEGIGGQDSPQAFLNQAVPGAKSRDIPSQVRVLVAKMKIDPRIDFQEDWKVITVFVGGNDLCDHCSDSVYFSVDNFVSHVREALDILHKEVPRALVNLVELLDIIPLRRLHQDKSLNCPSLVDIICRCVVKPREGSVELQKLTDLNRAYQVDTQFLAALEGSKTKPSKRGMQQLVESGRYDTHTNFSVVLQPFFRQVVLPLLEDGRPDRSYFSPDCFHLSQKSHALMARALWNNMLEPVGNKTYTQDFSSDLSMKCPSETSPFLRTYQNSNYTYQGPAPTPQPIMNWGSDLTCVNSEPSSSVPTSVHSLRPADIRVVASLGDSLTAAFGAKSKNLIQLRIEYRGVSWSIGGDQTLETVTTLPNILKKFNPSLRGFSLGQGIKEKGFNVAVSGAKAFQIPAQVEELIQAMRESEEVDFENDWKLVTLFIGGNDLCQYCQDRENLSPQNYVRHLMESLDLLYREVPRVLVNVLEILQIEGLRRIKSDTLGCTLLQKNVCPCIMLPEEDSLELTEMKIINREYQEETERLVSGGRYDGREDFAVVLQPYFRNSIIPIDSVGKPDLSYFSVDCFHFSERGHSQMAVSLWNNMLEPVGRKQAFNNFTHDRNKLRCPSKDQPFIFTRGNSLPMEPVPHCYQSLPVWAGAVLGLTGLLIGWGVTWLLLSCRERRNKIKMANMNVEMKGTGF